MLKLKRTMVGHSEYVYSVAFTPDAKTLATGGYDLTVRLWDTATGALQRTLRHGSWVLTVAISPDGKLLVSGGGGEHNSIKLWDLQTGELIHILDAHARHIEHLAFSHDGATLASSSGDGTVKLWNTTTWDVKQTLTGHEDDVGSVAFSPDWQLLVTSSDDSTVRIWDWTLGEQLTVLQWQRLPVLWATFSPDRQRIATAGYVLNGDQSVGEVRLWNITSRHCEAVLCEDTDAVFFVSYTRDGSHLIGSTADGYLLVWDSTTLTLKQRLQAHQGLIDKLAFSSDGTMLASASFDATAKVWNWSF